MSYTADWTGPTHSLASMLKYLRHDYEVAVLLPGEGPFSEGLREQRVRLFSFSRLDKWSIPRMIRLLRQQGFDLVYANTTGGSSRNAFLAAKVAGVPYVCHVRALASQQTWARMWYLRFAEAVIAVSRACGASVSRFVRPRSLSVVYNGVSLSLVGRNGEGTRGIALRKELGLPEDAFVVLSVGHVCERKGQEYAVRAMSLILREVPTAHLCLVGSLGREPSYVDHLRGLLSEQQLDRHVHFLGLRSDVPDLLHAADLFVHTAVADPHPRSVIEAMAAGLPVVAFAVDGVAETVVQGETGRLVEAKNVRDLAEGVVLLAGSPDARRRMGEAGRSRVQSAFTEERTAEQIRRVIDGVL